MFVFSGNQKDIKKAFLVIHTIEAYQALNSSK